MLDNTNKDNEINIKRYYTVPVIRAYEKSKQANSGAGCYKIQTAWTVVEQNNDTEKS